MLVNLSNQFLQTDPTSLAQEISRLESRFFLQIEVCGLLCPLFILLTVLSAAALATTCHLTGAKGRRDRPDNTVQPRV